MSYWTWDSSLSIGIDVIDGQHKRILDYINDLHEANQDNDREKVSEVIHGLMDYTVTHFTFEEQLMEKAGYPISDSHKMVHKSFVKRIENYSQRHERGENIARKLSSELRIWLTNHIKNEDADYAPYVKKSLNKQKGWIKRSLGKLFGAS
jgi:hemerythrin